MKKYLVVSRLSQENCLPGLQSKAEWLERPRDGETEKERTCSCLQIKRITVDWGIASSSHQDSILMPHKINE